MTLKLTVEQLRAAAQAAAHWPRGVSGGASGHINGEPYWGGWRTMPLEVPG